MGVSKYIEEISGRIEGAIQRNLEFIKANPYPLDELTQIKKEQPDSPISKAYDESGLVNESLLAAAATQDPALVKRLEKGAKSLKKIRDNENLSKVDPSSLPSARYSAFVKGLGGSAALGSGLTVKSALAASEEEFEEIYSQLISDARGNGSLKDQTGIDASISTVMAAFTELAAKPATGEAPAASPTINEVGTAAPAIEGQSAVNLPTGGAAAAEGTERISSTVVGAKVELPAEVPTAPEPVSINIENEAAAPATPPSAPAPEPRVESTQISQSTTQINDLGSESVSTTLSNESSTTNQTTNINSTVGEKSTVSPTEKKTSSSSSIVEQYLGFLPSEAKELLKESAREVERTSSQTINSATSQATQKEKESSAFEKKSDSSINSVEKGSAGFPDISKFSESDRKYFEKMTGVNLSSVFGKESSASTEKESVSKSEGGTTVTSEKSSVSSEKIGVTKESPVFNEKIMAATPPPAPASLTAGPVGGETAPTAKAEASSSPEIAMTPAPSEQPGAPAQGQPASTQMPGLGELAQRMARIEFLLSNTLEVKLVD